MATLRNKKGQFIKGNISFSKLNPKLMPRGKRHHLWKGEKVGYRGLHYWLKRKKGIAKICIKCGSTKGRIQWANVDGKYRRMVNDYKAMCPSCHKLHDIKLKKDGKKIYIQ